MMVTHTFSHLSRVKNGSVMWDTCPHTPMIIQGGGVQESKNIENGSYANGARE